MVKPFGRERIAVIGVTAPETAAISNPGDTVEFYDVRASVAHAVGFLQDQGVNKIIVLSHIGEVVAPEVQEAVLALIAESDLLGFSSKKFTPCRPNALISRYGNPSVGLADSADLTLCIRVLSAIGRSAVTAKLQSP